jgi:hypothetical protein
MPTLTNHHFGGLQVADAPKRFGDGAHSPHPRAGPPEMPNRSLRVDVLE